MPLTLLQKGHTDVSHLRAVAKVPKLGLPYVEPSLLHSERVPILEAKRSPLVELRKS